MPRLQRNGRCASGGRFVSKPKRRKPHAIANPNTAPLREDRWLCLACLEELRIFDRFLGADRTRVCSGCRRLGLAFFVCPADVDAQNGLRVGRGRAFSPPDSRSTSPPDQMTMLRFAARFVSFEAWLAEHPLANALERAAAVSAFKAGQHSALNETSAAHWDRLRGERDDARTIARRWHERTPPSHQEREYVGDAATIASWGGGS